MSSTRSTSTLVDPEAEHVAPINALVERLRRAGEFVPYVHHSHGGVHAPVLSVLRDPGKATGTTGVLSTDNPDATSRTQRALMAKVGLRTAELCPWNAYPWMTPDGREPSVEQIARGAVQLAELLGLMTGLRVLLLQGEQARWAWAMVQAFRPRYSSPTFEVVRTCHPLGTRDRSPQGAQQRKDDQEAAWRRAAEIAQRSRTGHG